jgi:hypothetical protein
VTRARQHTEAFIAAVTRDDGLAILDGRVAGKAPGRYAIVFAHRPEHATTRMSGTPRANEARVTVHSVGSTPAEAEWVADEIAARATPGIPGLRLMVADARQGVVRHAGGLPMRVDSTVPPAVYFFADEYAWEVVT